MYTNDFVRRMQSPGGERRRGRSMHIDIPLLLTLIVLCLGGLMVLYSASGQSTFYVKRQAFFMLAGFVAGERCATLAGSWLHQITAVRINEGCRATDDIGLSG